MTQLLKTVSIILFGRLKLFSNEIFIFFNRISAFTKVTRINSTDYEIKLVDTAGQDEYSIFPAQYSMDFHGYVLVYSITSQKSFEVIQIIYEKLLDVMGKAQYVSSDALVVKTSFKTNKYDFSFISIVFL